MKHIKMPRELADKWLKALRGGKYKQGFNKLHTRGHRRDGDTYCCLGVLQMVADGKTESHILPTIKWLKNHEIVFLEEWGDEGRDPFLSGLGDYASKCNDSGLSFEFIADAIEDEIEST